MGKQGFEPGSTWFEVQLSNHYTNACLNCGIGFIFLSSDLPVSIPSFGWCCWHALRKHLKPVQSLTVPTTLRCGETKPDFISGMPKHTVQPTPTPSLFGQSTCGPKGHLLPLISMDTNCCWLKYLWGGMHLLFSL